MGRISAGVGLVSGINSGDIIDQLMRLEERPKVMLQTRIDQIGEKKAAYTDLLSRLATLKTAATSLRRPSTFQQAGATSSNPDVLTAVASRAAAVGSYDFRVARLVSAQQAITNGFADPAISKVGAGTITLEVGGGELNPEVRLDALHGGAGARRGLMRITDRSGASAVIDTADAVTLDDVLRKINHATDINVAATLDGDAVVLTDRTGRTTSRLIVDDIDGSGAATDLGLVRSVAANTFAGTDVNAMRRETALTSLNDGRGVRTLGQSGNAAADFRVHTADGTRIDVAVGSPRTVGELLDAINAAAGNAFRAELAPGGNALRLQDRTTGDPLDPLAFRVTSLNGSSAARDLGVDGRSTASATLTGDKVLAAVGSTLTSTLFGGAGHALGDIEVHARDGTTRTIALRGSDDVATLLRRINDAGAGVRASLNAAGNGLALTDTTGGTGTLRVRDVSGTFAADTGLSGTFGIDVRSVEGKNLQRQWVHGNVSLKEYNAGRGVAAGRFALVDSLGRRTTIDVGATDLRLGDVMAKINASPNGVKVRVNDTGDGLLVEDTAGGTLTAKIEAVDGSITAQTLRLVGDLVGGRLEGRWEQSIAVTADDTLGTVRQKIQDTGFGVSAAIVNDGSPDAPHRLSLTARDTGRAGRFVFDAGTTGLASRTLVAARDAAVFVGDASAPGARPMLITSNTNEIKGAIQNVALTLNGTSDKPVTLNVARSLDPVVEEMKGFVENFNGMIEQITTLTKFDPETGEKGLLLGETAVQTLQSRLYAMLRTVSPGGGRYRILADVGVRIGDGAKLEFDESKLRDAFADDPQAVTDLFSRAENGIAAEIDRQITRLNDPIHGVLIRQNKTIDAKTEGFRKQISSLDTRLEAKRLRLTKQFVDMEKALGGLQSQQAALSQLQSIPPLQARRSRG